MRKHFDAYGVEIKAGDTIYNPFDRYEYYEVLSDGEGLFLGDLDSPLDKYQPEKFWQVRNDREPTDWSKQSSE